MAEGDGNVMDLVPDLLRGIRDEIRGLRGDVDALRGEVRGLDVRMHHVEIAQIETNLRLEKLIENTGAHWRDVEARVTDLERWRESSGR
jgi:hypothetical protein